MFPVTLTFGGFCDTIRKVKQVESLNMSRTYKYPRESLEDTSSRDESDASLRIRKRLEKQKQQRQPQRKKKIKSERLFKDLISYRDSQRAKTRV